MIDFHSHILPQIDDGAQNIKMSLDMLSESYRQGVRTVVATPHCYIANEYDIDIFLEKREKSYNILKKAMAEDGRDLPEIVLGCELQISKNVYHFEKLRPLCIENTDYILVEMPYGKWTEDCYDYLYELTLKGMRPIMAHIERFIGKKKDFHNLYSLDLLYQVNADSFLSPFVKRHLPDLFEKGIIQLLGSDMHNTTRRATHMKNAVERIVNGYGDGLVNYLMTNARKVINNESVEILRFEKMSFFRKFKL